MGEDINKLLKKELVQRCTDLTSRNTKLSLDVGVLEREIRSMKSDLARSKKVEEQLNRKLENIRQALSAVAAMKHDYTRLNDATPGYTYITAEITSGESGPEEPEELLLLKHLHKLSMEQIDG